MKKYDLIAVTKEGNTINHLKINFMELITLLPKYNNNDNIIKITILKNN